MTPVPTLLLLAACDITPAYVTSSDIDNALAQGRLKTVCHGLDMKDDDVRRYTTERLRTLDDPAAAQCVCDHVKPEAGGWDPALAEGLRGETNDEFVKCFADLVLTDGLEDRDQAVQALTKIPAKSSRTALSEIAKSPGDSTARVTATQSIAGDANFAEVTFVLLSDTDTAVRAMAAGGIGAWEDKIATKLAELATSDPEASVRAAAMLSVKKTTGAKSDDLLCKAMMEDADAEVRRKAVMAFKGSRRDGPMDCLKKRAFALEEDSGVRSAMLTVLKGSPNDKAAKILCDAIPFWMRSYAKEEIPEKIPGTLIVQAQNDRDWENSYKCVQRALAKGGYSCYARMHLGSWMKELGGNAHVPRCPGYEAE